MHDLFCAMRAAVRKRFLLITIILAFAAHAATASAVILAPHRAAYHDSEKYNVDLNTYEYSVEFSNNTQRYCVGLVDMVDSTKISAKLGWAKSSRYYQVFLNSLSEILSRFGGFVIKNVGDCLVYYFPESEKQNSKYGFMSCIECSLAMIEARHIICSQLEKEGLPFVSYRISSDYGSVVMMNSNGREVDFIGPPLNMCAKINRLASRNGIVIGGDLYQLVRKFDDYSFQEVKGYSVGFKYNYPVYSLTRKI